jgi:23S rRNA pseudouridine2605 synthase
MKRTDNFSKFAAKKSNSAIKEEFRQEKKKFKKERSDAIDKKKIEKRAASAADRSWFPLTVLHQANSVQQ